jgi:hypothetical protein
MLKLITTFTLVATTVYGMQGPTGIHDMTGISPGTGGTGATGATGATGSGNHVWGDKMNDLKNRLNQNPNYFFDSGFHDKRFYQRGKVKDLIKTLTDNDLIKNKTRNEREQYKRESFANIKASIMNEIVGQIKGQNYVNDHQGPLRLDELAADMDINDVEGLMNFTNLGELKNMPEGVVNQMSDEGFNAAPNGFLKHMQKAGKLMALDKETIK